MDPSVLARMRAYLKTDIRYDQSSLPRPFFVEIAGPPSSGKSSIIEELDTFFRSEGLRVRCPQEGAQVIRHIVRTTPLYNIRTGLYALEMLTDWSQGHPYDVVIFERCIFDAYSWMTYWESKGKLSTEEKNLLQKFFMLRFWANMIDAACFVICDVDEAMRRYSGSSGRVGKTTNPETVAALRERYLEAHRALKPSYPQLNLIDTTRMDETAAFEHTKKAVLELFEKRISK